MAEDRCGMTTFAEELKASTRKAHESAEGNQFQKELFSGNLPVTEYAEYLKQLYLIHSRLEEHLEKIRAADGRLAPVVHDIQFQREFLRTDLKHLNESESSNGFEPLPTTVDFINRLDQSAKQTPVSLLGAHYVLLGSKHGGKFICQVLKKQYQFTDAGCLYFDPYGGEFRQHWLTFVDGMNGAGLTGEERSAIVDLAGHTFDAVGNVGLEIQRKYAAIKKP
jgi:heme oxygenase (biliverdin-producing, ferredoxin)